MLDFKEEADASYVEHALDASMLFKQKMRHCKVTQHKEQSLTQKSTELQPRTKRRHIDPDLTLEDAALAFRLAVAHATLRPQLRSVATVTEQSSIAHPCDDFLSWAQQLGSQETQYFDCAVASTAEQEITIAKERFVLPAQTTFIMVCIRTIHKITMLLTGMQSDVSNMEPLLSGIKCSIIF